MIGTIMDIDDGRGETSPEPTHSQEEPLSAIRALREGLQEMLDKKTAASRNDGPTDSRTLSLMLHQQEFTNQANRQSGLTCPKQVPYDLRKFQTLVSFTGVLGCLEK